MEREVCVCDHGFERSDLCAEIIIIIIIIIHSENRKTENRKIRGIQGLLLLFKEICCLHIKNRFDLYPVPFSFLLFKVKKRVSVVTS